MAILNRRKSVKGHAAFTIRVDPELKKRIEILAYNKKQSLSVTIEQLFEKALGETA